MFARKGIAVLGLSLMLATGIFAVPIQKEKAATKTSQPAAKEEKAAKPAAKEATSSPKPAHSKKHHRKHHRKHDASASPTK